MDYQKLSRNELTKVQNRGYNYWKWLLSEDKKKWHKWIAWYPVCVNKETKLWAWFTPMERRLILTDEEYNLIWEYRLV